MTQLLVDKKILGFWAGDKRICKSQDAKPSITIIDTIRSTFPRGKAIIWLNECTSTWPHYSMPVNADWVSIDHYRKKKDDNYISDLKDLFKSKVFKKLHDHQKVLIVPGVGHPKDNYKICDDKCTAKIELDCWYSAIRMDARRKT